MPGQPCYQPRRRALKIAIIRRIKNYMEFAPTRVSPWRCSPACALALEGRIAVGSGALLRGRSGRASGLLRSCPVCKCPDESPLGVATAGAVLEALFALTVAAAVAWRTAVARAAEVLQAVPIFFPSSPCVQDRRRKRGCPAARGFCCGRADWQSGNGSVADFSIDTAINSAFV